MVPHHRYNVSRVYDPDGDVVASCPKIHSCEENFWHGYHYGEEDAQGVPVCMHICHDSRYPDIWTVPVMFGARLILHPANDEKPEESIDAFGYWPVRAYRASEEIAEAYLSLYKSMGGL